MKLKKFSSVASLGIAVVTTGVILSSCTCKIKDEQLAELAELRRNERSLSSDLTTQQNLKTKLESELQSRVKEVKDCGDRLEIVKQRLSIWPNIWPDFTVQP